jgi:hypothetical protein
MSAQDTPAGHCPESGHEIFDIFPCNAGLSLNPPGLLPMKCCFVVPNRGLAAPKMDVLRKSSLRFFLDRRLLKAVPGQARWPES